MAGVDKEVDPCYYRGTMNDTTYNVYVTPNLNESTGWDYKVRRMPQVGDILSEPDGDLWEVTRVIQHLHLPDESNLDDAIIEVKPVMVMTREGLAQENIA